ncbi:unnamed protein product [Ilex paraguariensis]|uniref:Uncharacterized protein n=1 Tax=Ilex paraguariensis TaxID=185542 RepID=A0ABC8U5I1_9AQUA
MVSSSISKGETKTIKRCYEFLASVFIQGPTTNEPCKEVLEKSSAELFRVYSPPLYKPMSLRDLVTTHNLFKFGLGPVSTIEVIVGPIVEVAVEVPGNWRGGREGDVSSSWKRLRGSSFSSAPLFLNNH